MRSSRQCRKQVSRAAARRFGGSTNATTSAIKKTLYAVEQKRLEVARARRRWMREQGMFDPARLVFIDETWTNTSMDKQDRKSTRLNSSHRCISYAVFCLKKKITDRSHYTAS